MRPVIRTIFISLFIGLVLLQTFDKATIIIHYQMNKDYIIENFCVNIDEPELMCSGKCYLSFELAQQEQEQQNPLLKVETKELTYVLQDLADLALFSTAHRSAIPKHYIAPEMRMHIGDVFHPPRV